MKKTSDLVKGNKRYNEKFDLKSFEEATFAILGTEVFTILMQAIFLQHYIYIYRTQLFPGRYRRRTQRMDLEDGTIYDYDPDQEVEIPNYINRYPPTMQDYSENYD